MAGMPLAGGQETLTFNVRDPCLGSVPGQLLGHLGAKFVPEQWLLGFSNCICLMSCRALFLNFNDETMSSFWFSAPTDDWHGPWWRAACGALVMAGLLGVLLGLRVLGLPYS